MMLLLVPLKLSTYYLFGNQSVSLEKSNLYKIILYKWTNKITCVETRLYNRKQFSKM